MCAASHHRGHDPLHGQRLAPTLPNGGRPGSAPARPLSLGERIAAIPLKSMVMLTVGVAALVGVALALALWSRSGDYKLLYANLSDKDGGAVLGQLSQMNIPYRITEGGGAIMVPADKVHDVRLCWRRSACPRGRPAASS